MDGFMHPYAFPFFGLGMLIWLIPWLIIAYLVYQDAEKRGLNGLLWFILVIIPVLGILFLILYFVVRESKAAEKTSLEILKERYARGDKRGGIQKNEGRTGKGLRWFYGSRS